MRGDFLIHILVLGFCKESPCFWEIHTVVFRRKVSLCNLLSERSTCIQEGERENGGKGTMKI